MAASDYELTFKNRLRLTGRPQMESGQAGFGCEYETSDTTNRLQLEHGSAALKCRKAVNSRSWQNFPIFLVGATEIESDAPERNALRVFQNTIIFLVFCLLFSAALKIAFVAGQSSPARPTTSERQAISTAYELARATPPGGLLLAGRDDCVAANDSELAVVELAVNILELPNDAVRSLADAAVRTLSTPAVRQISGPTVWVCDDAKIFERVQVLIDKNRHLLSGRLVEHSYGLIARLPKPSSAIIRQLAESAFSETRQDYGAFRRDLRPLARATLAAIEGGSSAYAVQAFSEISIDDPMGTGAAQIAVAGGHPEALSKVQTLMDQLLSTLPAADPIPWEARNRLYEMAQALAYGGSEARNYVSPLRELMSRQVESNATMFGMVVLPPRRMCPLIAKVLEISTSEVEYTYCQADSEDFVLEQ